MLYILRFKYGKILYDTDEGAANLKILFGKIAALLFIGAALWHLNENPIGILIFVLPALFLLLFFNYEGLILFEDRFIYTKAFSPMWGKRYKEFLYKDLEKVINPVEYNIEGLPKKKATLNKVDPRKKVHIVYNNGNYELFSLQVNWGFLNIAVNYINKEIQKHRTVKSR